MNHRQKTEWMQQAIALAEKGRGCVNPNPLVGALIVKDGRVIAEGYHQQFGGPHAEVNAFNHATEDVEGATMFVTLEPCAHYGKTPPCALKIIEKKIKKVIIAKTDPNPLVNMKGIAMLEAAGVIVEHGLLAEEVTRQNEVFLKYIATKRPFVALKYAISLDGKIATHRHDSKWISNASSRHYVHQLRQNYMAIMVGVQTIVDDDAHLDVRLDTVKRQPIRIIIDPHLRIPRDAYVIKSSSTQPTYIVTTKEDKTLVELGVRLIVMEIIDLSQLMIMLGKENIDSILIEGGATTHAYALEAGIVDKVYAFIAPKLIGGEKAPSPIGGIGVDTVKLAHQLDDVRYHYFDDNILIEGNLIRR